MTKDEKIAREKALEKVRKMFALTNDSGAFEGEIANASRMMQKLMDQYHISAAEAATSEEEAEVQENFTTVKADILFGRVKEWHWYLASACARITSTKTFTSGGYGKSARDKSRSIHGRRFQFYGKEEAAELAAELYKEWAVAIDNMARISTAVYLEELKQNPEIQARMILEGVKQVRHLPDMGHHHPNVWRASWLLGVVGGIHSQIDEQERERTNETSTALMVIKDKLDTAYKEKSKDFAQRGVGSSNYNGAANRAGREHGESINLMSAVQKKVSP